MSSCQNSLVAFSITPLLFRPNHCGAPVTQKPLCSQSSPCPRASTLSSLQVEPGQALFRYRQRVGSAYSWHNSQAIYGDRIFCRHFFGCQFQLRHRKAEHAHRDVASVPTEMRYDGPQIDPADRILSSLPYLMPLIDALGFGRYFFRQFPEVSGLLLLPLEPLITIYRGIPFVSLGVYLALFVFVVRNPQVSRFIRFNTMQALFMDVLLIIPGLAGSLNVARAVPPVIAEGLSNTVFYGTVFSISYAVICCVLGKLADQIPVISDSVQSQIGQ